MARTDPFHGFRFRVEIDQLQHGAFSRVKGLVRETKVEPRREGGVNDFEHKFATMTTYPNLILERGLGDDALWKWHEEVVEGRITRKTITIALLDEATNDVWRWLVEAAFPVKWTGTDFDANNGQVTFESVELAHHGIRRA
jgi:phage tail-like protein